MPLKLVAVAVLVPPTALVFVILLGLLLGRRRIGRLLVWFGALGLLVLSMPAVGGALLVALERDLPLTPPTDRPPQAIVILSGDVRRSQGEPPGVHVGPLTLDRLRAGAELARRTGLPILVSGGTLQDTDPPLARLMADSLAQDFQVPARWIEPESRDTWQNAKFSAAMLREHDIGSIYLVTNAWHMRRALLSFAPTGLTVTAAPTMLDHAPTPLPVDFVPSAGGWLTSYFALHEWIGLAWYSLR